MVARLLASCAEGSSYCNDERIASFWPLIAGFLGFAAIVALLVMIIRGRGG